MRRKIDLLMTISSAALNICGYLSGLSSPSVTRDTTFARSPRSNKAGQTRLPTFSIMSTEPKAGASCRAAAYHVGFEVTAGSRIDLHRRRAGRLDALGVIERLLIALDDADRHLVLQIADGAFEQGGLAGAGELTRLRARISRPSNQARLRSASLSFLSRMAVQYRPSLYGDRRPRKGSGLGAWE